MWVKFGSFGRVSILFYFFVLSEYPYTRIIQSNKFSYIIRPRVACNGGVLQEWLGCVKQGIACCRNVLPCQPVGEMWVFDTVVIRRSLSVTKGGEIKTKNALSGKRLIYGGVSMLFCIRFPFGMFFFGIIRSDFEKQMYAPKHTCFFFIVDGRSYHTEKQNVSAGRQKKGFHDLCTFGIATALVFLVFCL